MHFGKNGLYYANSGVEERYLGRLITSRRRFDSGPRNTVVTQEPVPAPVKTGTVPALVFIRKSAQLHARFFYYAAFSTYIQFDSDSRVQKSSVS